SSAPDYSGCGPSAACRSSDSVSLRARAIPQEPVTKWGQAPPRLGATPHFVTGSQYCLEQEGNLRSAEFLALQSGLRAHWETLSMELPRSSGILLHPTSLPGSHGIGDLGPAAFAFVDFLETCGQKWWQMLPIGPTGYGNSPYQSPSSFAGNPLLISL